MTEESSAARHPAGPLGPAGASEVGSREVLALVELAERAAGGEVAAGGSPLQRLERALRAVRSQRDDAEREQRRAEELLRRTESTVRALRTASQVAPSVASAFGRDRVLAAIPDAMIRIFGAATARVWLVGPGDRCAACPQAVRCPERRECLQLVPHGERGPLDLALARVPIGDHSVGRVAQQRRLIWTNDVSREPGLADPDWARVERIRSFAGHPLIHDGRLLGAVAMWGRAPIREEMLEALAILAQHGATAIAVAQLIETAREEGASREVAAARLGAVLDAGRNAVILFGDDDRAIFSNESFRRIFQLDDTPLDGLPRAEVEALLQRRVVRSALSSPESLLAPPPAGASAPAASPAARGEVFVPARGESGLHVIQVYRARVLAKTGASYGWMVAFADITASREIDRLKSEFVSTVSHELRTPLTSIKGALALLLDGTVPLDPETSQLLKISERNADRLVRLVGDILDISKLETDKIELRLEKSAPGALCETAAEEIAGVAGRSKVALRVEVEPGLPAVDTDAERVMQILSNLLSNAIKFSPAGGAVVLRARRGDGVVRFEVEDRGPGVPLEFRGKLFTKFAQARRTEREQSGTGLGLAICQALVQKLGGEIGCESEPGEGANFFFTLPALAAGARGAGT